MDDVDQLVRRVRSGEVELFAEIIRRFERPVWRVVAAILQDTEQSRELMQQAFVDAYRHLDQYRLGGDFAGWIKTIARNRVRQELRRLSRESRHLADYREGLEMRLRDTEAAERQEGVYLEALRKCREHLPEPSSRVLSWRYDEGKTFEEIAAALDMTRAAVEKLLSRIRIALRECIENRLAES